MLSLVTERLIIRQANVLDAEVILHYTMSNKDFHQPSSPLREHAFYTLEFQEDVLDQDDDSKLLLLIFDRNDPKEVIGSISFTEISYGAFCSCYLGYGMDLQHVGLGLMTEALQAAIDHIFDEGKLHRIQANVMPANAASIRVLEKLGFQREGFHPNYLKINGNWEDHISFALINE